MAIDAQVFPVELRPSLTRVVDKARGSFGDPNYPYDAGERSDSANVREALGRLGYEVSLSDAAGVWELVSLNLMAGWMMGAETVEGAIGGIRELCEHVAAGDDYAGFSGISGT